MCCDSSVTLWCSSASPHLAAGLVVCCMSYTLCQDVEALQITGFYQGLYHNYVLCCAGYIHSYITTGVKLGLNGTGYLSYVAFPYDLQCFSFTDCAVLRL